jgi:hypothetical protein
MRQRHDPGHLFLHDRRPGRIVIGDEKGAKPGAAPLFGSTAPFFDAGSTKGAKPTGDPVI